MLRRYLTTRVRDPQEAIRELKRHVHRLYKHIHPDRLGKWPEHRAVNEASFQVLQSALDRHFDRVEARIPNVPPQAYQRAQQLTFFAHGASSARADNQVEQNGLRKAVVRFHESNLGNALHSLFESLGLEPPPKNVLPGLAHGTAAGEHQFSSLTELVKHARHVIMTKVKKQHSDPTTSAQSGMHDEVVVTRLALQRSRGVTITLGPGLPPNQKLVAIFRRLTRTLAHARDAELHNLVVEIDGGFEVSFCTTGVYPWITLGACATGETWVNSLLSEEVRSACEKTKRRMERLRKMECVAADALGIKMLMHNISVLDMTEDHANMSNVPKGAKLSKMLTGSVTFEQYESLLQSLIHETEQNGDFQPQQGVESIVIMVEEHGEVETDADEGVIRVGLQKGVNGLLTALKEKGRSVNETFKRLKALKEAEQNLVASVKRAVGIDSLRRGEGISDKQWADALARLRADAGRLRGVLDGVGVVIGTQARIVVDSGEIEVPFDFHRSIQI